jgi:hypothetical protein
MADTKSRSARRLGTRFGLGVVSLAVAIVVLLTVGDQYVPELVDRVTPLTIVVVLVIVYLVILLTRLPYILWWPTDGEGVEFEAIPELETELEDLIDDLLATLESHREQLTGLDVGGAETAVSRLERIEHDLEHARERLSTRRYVSAYRRYYHAQRELIDVLPALVVADRSQGRPTNRLREQADTLRTQASVVRDNEVTEEIETLLESVTVSPLPANPREFDTGPLKMAARRIDGYRLARLKYVLRLRGVLTTLNRLLGVTVLFLFVLPVLLTVGIRVLLAAFPGLEVSAPLQVSVLFWQFPLVLFFGFLGAAVNIARRLGGGFGFFETGETLELPTDVILSKLVWSRLLFGSLAGLVVYVFATSSTNSDAVTFTVQFVIITSFFAGFSEQFFDRALSEAQRESAGDGRNKRAGTEVASASENGDATQGAEGRGRSTTAPPDDATSDPPVDDDATTSESSDRPSTT